MQRKVTSFSNFITGEGERIAFTYSEMEDNGKLLSQNNKGTFVALDQEVIEKMQWVRKYIEDNILEG